MTGFGRAEGLVHEKKVTVELRSVNGKQLDLQVKLPSAWREKEIELRQWAGTRVVRGKADLYIAAEGTRADKRSAFNADLVRAYYEELQQVAKATAPEAHTDLLAIALRMPDVMAVAKEELDPKEWEGTMLLVEQAWQAYEAFRVAEGEKLHAELKERTANITRLLAEVATMDNGRMDRTRDRLMARMDELKVNVDLGRLEQELVYYLEKLDVTEEKVRLATHCAYFLETMELEDCQGRKLGFISQEMGREINTLGSKSNDAAMQRIVVLMKDELEKIKEQMLNVL